MIKQKIKNNKYDLSSVDCLVRTCSQNSFFNKCENDWPSTMQKKDNFNYERVIKNELIKSEENSLQDAVSQLYKQVKPEILASKKNSNIQRFIDEINKQQQQQTPKSNNRKRKKLSHEIICKLAKELANMIENTADEIKSKSTSLTTDDQAPNKDNFDKIFQNLNLKQKNSLSQTNLNESIMEEKIDTEKSLEILINSLKKNLSVPLNKKYLIADKKVCNQDRKTKTTKANKENQSHPKRRLFKILEAPLENNKLFLSATVKNEKINTNYNDTIHQNYLKSDKQIPHAVRNKNDQVYCLHNNIILPACTII